MLTIDQHPLPAPPSPGLKPEVPPTISHVHIPALDGVRGLAILLVLITHGVDASLRASTPVEHVVYNVARWGWIGVDLFFALSGFLITGILLKSRTRDNYLLNFYARRILRIFPLYCATVLVCLVLVPLIPWSRFDWLRDLSSQQAWFWLHLGNYYKICINDPPVYWLSTLWSLAVEEHFYLVWPFIVWMCPTPRLLQLCALGIVAALGLRIILTFAGFPGDYIYRSTPTRLDPLLMGASLAILLKERGTLADWQLLSRLLVLIGVGAILVQMVLRGGSHGRDTTVYGMTLQYTLIGLMFTGLLAVVLNSRGDSFWQGLFTWGPLLVLGKYSYAIYILNKPSYYLVKEFFRPAEWPVFGSPLPGVAVFVVLGSCVTFLGAQITWRLLEKPCLDLKRYFESR